MSAPSRTPLTCSEVLGGSGPCDLRLSLAGWDAACWSAPHGGGATGGDIYYLSVCGHNVLSKAVVADVSGHGQSVGEAARIIHDAVQTHRDEHDNAAMLAQVNRDFIARQTGDLRFTTMVATILDNRDRSLVYAYGGHPAILRGEARTGRFRPIEAAAGSARGLPLGIMPDATYTEGRTTMEEGDVLVLYTDAFTELRDGGARTTGAETLVAALERVGPDDPGRLKDAVLAETGGRLGDDATLVILRIR